MKRKRNSNNDNQSNDKDGLVQYPFPDEYKNPSYEGDPRINFYQCDLCQSYFTTVDVDLGVTPFMMRCKDGYNLKCKGTARSFCYPRIPDRISKEEKHLMIWEKLRDTKWEWYRPLKLPKEKSFHDHYLNGGLDIRPRTDAKPVCHKD